MWSHVSDPAASRNLGSPRRPAQLTCGAPSYSCLRKRSRSADTPDFTGYRKIASTLPISIGMLDPSPSNTHALDASFCTLSQRIEPALQRERHIAQLVPYDRWVLANARSLSPNQMFVARRLDRRERRPLSLASFPRWQKLAAQHVLLFSTGRHNVPNAHITKAHRIWWAVGMKISSGCCKQELYD